MDFPAAWTILPAEEYALAAPRIDGDLTLELMAQVRHTGRILDHFRMACGGSKPLEVDVDFGAMLPMPAFKGWRLQAQFWPRDLLLRQNTFSSAWIDTVATIGMREVTILDQHGAIIPCTEVLRILDRPEDDEDENRGPDGSSFRWAVVAGEDSLLRLQMQSLPGQAVLISGKALLKGFSKNSFFYQCTHA